MTFLLPKWNPSSQSSKNLSSNTGRKIKPLKISRIKTGWESVSILRWSSIYHRYTALWVTSFFDHKDVKPRYQTMLGKRVERVWGWDCHGLPIEQKVQKNSVSNQTKKSRNQPVESRDLSMSVMPIHAILQQNGVGISIISVDGSIWRVRTAQWIRTIWSLWCGFSSKSGRSDISTKGSVSHGILGNSPHRFQLWNRNGWQLSGCPGSSDYCEISDKRREKVRGSSSKMKTENLMIKIRKMDSEVPRRKCRVRANHIILQQPENCSKKQGLLVELQEYCSTYWLSWMILWVSWIPMSGPSWSKSSFSKKINIQSMNISLDALPVRSEIHRMEHDWIDFMTGVREPVLIPEKIRNSSCKISLPGRPHHGLYRCTWLSQSIRSSNMSPSITLKRSLSSQHLA